MMQFVVYYLMAGGAYPFLYVGRAIVRRIAKK